jgi:hypothetical protein
MLDDCPTEDAMRHDPKDSFQYKPDWASWAEHLLEAQNIEIPKRFPRTQSE